MRRWRQGVAAALVLALAVFVAAPGAQGQFWVLVNGALNYTGTVTITGPLSLSGFGNGVSASTLYLTQGPITVNTTPIINITSTWNEASTIFSGIVENITNTASSALSSLLDLQKAGVSQFKGTRDGSVVILGNFTFPGSGALIATGRMAGLAPGVSQWNFSDTATTIGVGVDFATDNVLKVRTRAQTGYATVDALAYNAGGDIMYLQTVPTITSGFSTSTPSIAGKASVFAVTIAATPGVTGLVAFNGTFTNIPSCSGANTITANAIQCVPTTTTATLNGAWVANDVVRCLV